MIIFKRLKFEIYEAFFNDLSYLNYQLESILVNLGGFCTIMITQLRDEFVPA